MTDAIVKVQDPGTEFKARVIERMKADIGSLMPDEVLQALVKEAVQQLFFQKVRVPKPGRSHYSDEMVEHPSWFVAEVMKQVEPLVLSEVAKYVAEHENDIQTTVRATLERDKVALVAVAVVGRQVGEQFAAGFGDMMQNLRNQGLIR